MIDQPFIQVDLVVQAFKPVIRHDQHIVIRREILGCPDHEIDQCPDIRHVGLAQVSDEL